MTPRVIVIGAGIGGLAAAAVLSRRGVDVTVLEAHIYPGGSAGTFVHQGYKFDAGATLAGGFYPGGPMDLLAVAAGVESWPLLSEGDGARPTMTVHLPDGTGVDRWSNGRRWEARRSAFGPQSEIFWEWQERTADDLWNLALRLPEWPPSSASGAYNLLKTGFAWLLDSPSRLRPGMIADAFRPVASHLSGQSQMLKDFVDAQLLISAQAESQRVYSLYGASALDLPRRGIRHVRGGLGAIAETLVDTVRRNGGQVLYRKEVVKIEPNGNSGICVETKRGERFSGEMLLANLPPQNIRALLHPDAAPSEIHSPENGWGAFIIYAGVKSELINERTALHHQVLVRRPFAEGNSLFLSISHPDDPGRAPEGYRAITISTHTDLRPWWHLFEHDRDTYDARKEAYLHKILANADRVVPGISSRASLVLPGTPVTFQRFTRRAWGWVGGIPQTSIWKSTHPQISQRIWMVGDTVFPGQSVPAVALGGIRVAREMLRKLSSTRAHSMAISLPSHPKTSSASGD